MRPSAAELRALSRRDPAVGALLRRHGPYPDFPLPQVRRWTHFQMLARAIVFQQLAGNAARAIFRRVHQLSPGPRFPTPRELLNTPPERLRAAGLSRNKMLSLLDLAEKAESGALRLRSVHRMPDSVIVEHLAEVRGIGVWTAQMFLIFRLGRLDVLPALDLGVQEGIRRLDGLSRRPTPKEVELRGDVWAPLRSVGSWLMWRLCDTKAPGAT
ncbi:MAG: DNA-3-methyladenine glycosylase 2 family protein [Planctomycetota bacterium]|nr:MAG: DNA-3-methyladenine glycosylase 2 family protein [Planctomycetota bacterium]